MNRNSPPLARNEEEEGQGVEVPIDNPSPFDLRPSPSVHTFPMAGEWRRTGPFSASRSEGDKGPPYEWSEIEDVLSGALTIPQIILEQGPPHVEPRDCPTCGQRMRWIPWCTSDECWQMEAGRAGYVEICEPCRSWDRFDGRIFS